MKMVKNFGRDVFIIAVSNLLITLKGLISLPFLSKSLDVASYGMWSQITITSSLLVPIITLGLPIGLVRFLASENKQEKVRGTVYSVVLLTLLVSFGVCLFLNIFQNQVSTFLGISTFLVRYLSLFIIVDSLSLVLVNVFRALGKITYYASFLVFETFVEVGVIAIVLLRNASLEQVVFAVFLTRVIFFLLKIIVIIKQIGFLIPHFSGIKEIVNYSIYTVSGNISSWIIKSSDRYFINLFLGITFVGFYSPAYQFSMILMLIITPLTFVLPVFLSRFFDTGNIKDIQKFLSYSTKYYLMISIPIAVALSIIAKELLALLSTQEISNNSYFIIPVVMGAMIFLGLKSIYSQIFLVAKKTKINAFVWITGAIMNLFLNFLLIPAFGLMGAALSTIISYFITLVVAIALSRRYIQFSLPFWTLIKTVAFSSLLGYLLFLYQPKSFLQIFFSILLLAFLYIALLFISKSVGKKEFDYFKRLFSFQKFDPSD